MAISRKQTCERHRASGRRSGVTLMEILISIGVIALGIFGVAALIPVAQFKVAEGTSSDRVASLGPSAASQFRIHGMGDPNNWVLEGMTAEMITKDKSLQSQQDFLERRAYCIDPLWLSEAGYITASGGQPQHHLRVFPASLMQNNPVNEHLKLGMHRLTVKNLKTGFRQEEAALARKIFLLADEVVFDRPADQTQQPRRQYFVDSTNHATTSVTNASLSWFATLCPYAANSDDYLLSIVVVKDRMPLLQFTEDATQGIASAEEKITQADSVYSGEVRLQAPLGIPDDQFRVDDLKTGDWILLSKLAVPPPPATNSQFYNSLSKFDQAERVYRWTQIIGTSQPEVVGGTRLISFTVSNDDFYKPGETGGTAILVRGVRSVYERTIRLEKLRWPL